MKTIIIINRKAGKRIFLDLYLPQVIRVLEKGNIAFRICYTRYSGHAAILTAKYANQVDFITIFGGDGTIREVIKGMAENPIPIGIIPFGTVNVLALDLGISFNPVIAADNLVKGCLKNIDVGYLNGEPFLLMVSAGIDALAVHNVDLRTKRYLGKVAYVISALWAAFTYRSRRVRIVLNDQGIKDRGYQLIISNSRFYGGSLRLDERASIDDGWLDIILFKKSSILDTFRLLMGVLLHIAKGMDDVACYRSRDILIDSRGRVNLQMDGDKAPPAPARVRVKKHQLPVIVPRKDLKQEGFEAIRTVITTVFSVKK